MTNLQGDVIKILDYDKNVVANYSYDAWGRVIAVTDANGNAITNENHIGNTNPLRYRGYMYDTETKLYYCNSRYYDPQVKRFINIDMYVSTGTGFLGYNMYAYCNNNPVTRTDATGEFYYSSATTVIVQQGDTLWSIAEAVCGSGNGYMWKNIGYANNPFYLMPGEMIDISAMLYLGDLGKTTYIETAPEYKYDYWSKSSQVLIEQYGKVVIEEQEKEAREYGRNLIKNMFVKGIRNAITGGLAGLVGVPVSGGISVLVGAAGGFISGWSEPILDMIGDIIWGRGKGLGVY